MLDWSAYPNFTRDEFACSHTGECEMDADALAFFQSIRTRLGRPMTVNSGYRAASHPAERKKARPGAHAQGTAADFAVIHGGEAFEIVEAALAEAPVGMDLGIGIAKTFVHIDIGHAYAKRPAIWSY